MMEAVVNSIDHGTTQPPELRIGLNCQNWNALPDSGGYKDQKYLLMRRINITMNIHRVVSKVRRAKGKEIHRLSGHDRRIIAALLEEGIM